MRGYSKLLLLLLAATLVGCNEAAVRREANKAVVRQWIEALNANDTSRLARIVQPDFVRHSQATPDVVVESLEDFIRFNAQTLAIFPDAEVAVEQLVAEGDRVAFWGTFAGTQSGPMGSWPATGKRMEIDIAGIFRFEEGKIAELWITWDNVAGLTQLGLLPTTGPSMEGGEGGENAAPADTAAVPR